MRLTPRLISSAAAIAMTLLVSAAALYYKSRSVKNEVMVFCKLQYNAHNSFDKLISFVEAARRSVNVCMPSIHNPAIQGRLVDLIKKKHIKVRIIIDKTGYNASTELFLKELIDAGAEIRCKTIEPASKMHHKFCMVDDKLLMTGTLNWGNDRSADHWNYVYITTKHQLVNPVKNEFYHMWDCSIDIRNVEMVEDYMDSDVESVDIDQDKVSDDFEGLKELLTPTLRETQFTPELCIM